MQLKWDQGLASRGKLKGKQTFDDAATPSKKTFLTSTKIRWAEASPTGETKSKKRKRELDIQDVVRDARNKTKRPDDTIDVRRIDTPDPLMRMTAPVPDILRRDNNAQLFSHYLNHVAKVTVVSNNDKNPFRTIICPMSFESPLIMSNILAIAAANLSNTRPEYGIVAYQHLNNAYSDLKRRLASPELALTEITLAGVLGQVSCQLHIGDVANWRVHLTAARGIVNALGGPKAVLHKKPEFRFYIQHLAWLDTLAATTSSTKRIGETDYWQALLQSIQEPVSAYGMKELMGCPENLLVIIAEMTRRFDDHVEPCEQAHPLAPRKIVELGDEADQTLDDFSQLTREQLGLEFAAKLDALEPENPPDASDSALHEIFRIAARIYLTYRIMHSTCWSAALQKLLRQAIDLLALIPARSSEEMALPWPLFIMGSICVYVREQKIIRARYAVMTKYMGFGNINRCIELLEEVWAGWREAELRSCPSRIAGLPWDERELGRKRWEDVMLEKGYDLLLA